MNKVIEKFGAMVGQFTLTSPRKALSLLKVGYKVSSFQMKSLPDNRLLPSQQYVANMNNRTILRSLQRPERCAMVNLFFPCEVLHAMHILPMFTEGLAGYLNGANSEGAFIGYAENSGVPQTFCSYHKTLLGAALSDVLEPPRFVANTSLACDANLSTFRTIAAHYQVPHFVVDVPGVCTAETIAYVAGQLEDVTHMIEEVMGEKLEEDRLVEVMRSENRSLRMYREHLHLLAGKYMPSNLTTEMHKLFPTHVSLGTSEAEEYFRLLLEDTNAAVSSHGETRLLWVHTIPSWQDSMRELFNFNTQRQLLACDLNFDYVDDVDASHPYEAMAKRLLLNSFNGSGENRAVRLLEMARELKADGVIYFCHWGCKQTLGNAHLMSAALEQAGIPVLVLDGDGCDRKNINDGQMSTRMQAFLEMLEGRS
ncbi:MAG TPA: 2-hydroxyacyl-CoA dehydratase [Anaerolineaceae bacterium]|uniref:Uncharacterized protein n=1 Tax=Anaerolinea thermophila TaxID=167964 RepID=A0A117LH16_9CHLR|nr:MAG: hypothetical protein XD73_0402 [Anaerolinea thermophila]HAF62484.1 2-hydroxyacyl-CoA dehydratase [Anaerolineaceae bacterium]